MKITIATGPLLPVPAVKGGAIPRLWHALAVEFARAGHEVVIAARAFAGQPKEEVLDGVKVVRCGGFDQSLSLRRDLIKDFFYAARLTLQLPAADILVTNDFWLPVFTSPLRRNAGRIVVNANRFPKGQFRLYRGAARIAAASTAVKNAVIRECPSLAERTVVMPNPVDTVLLKPLPGMSKETKTLLYVGRLHPEKGVHLLIQAFGVFLKSNSNWRLSLVGPTATDQGGGGESYRQNLESLAAGMPVEFVGPVHDPVKLAAIYQKADLFCYPSLAEKGEAFGVAPLESMACGVPVIVSGLECFRDYFVEGVNGLSFDHRAADPISELAKKLALAAASREKLAGMGRRAVQTAQEFSYPVVAKKYLEDFATLTKNTNGDK